MAGGWRRGGEEGEGEEEEEEEEEEEGGWERRGCICPHTQRLPGSATAPYALRREGGTHAHPD